MKDCVRELSELRDPCIYYWMIRGHFQTNRLKYIMRIWNISMEASGPAILLIAARILRGLDGKADSCHYGNSRDKCRSKPGTGGNAAFTPAHHGLAQDICEQPASQQRHIGRRDAGIDVRVCKQ